MNSKKRVAYAAIAAAGLVAPLGLTISAAHADSDYGYIIGTVTDSAGHPVTDATVRATSTSLDSESDRTDRNGRYVIPVYRSEIADGGTWTITAGNAAGLTDSAAQPVTAPAVGQNVGGPTITLAADVANPPTSGVVLTGSVTTPNGLAHGGYVEAYDAASGRPIDGAAILSNGFYYFTGSSTPGDYDVNGKSVKLEFNVNGYLTTFNGGGLSQKAAPAIAVPAYGAAAATVNGSVGAEASIVGTVKLPGATNWSATATVLDQSGEEVGADYNVDAAGNFSIDVPPGTYYVRADGQTWDSFTPTGSTYPDTYGYYNYVAGYYGKKATSLATATKVVVGANQNKSVGTITLTNALHATEKPFVKVKKGIQKGGKLSVDHGTWNHEDAVTYSYAWKVGKKTVGTKANLKITKKVWKKLGNGKKVKKLTVTVTASDKYGHLVSGSANQKVVKTLAKEQKEAAKDAKKAQKQASKVKKQTSK